MRLKTYKKTLTKTDKQKKINKEKKSKGPKISKLYADTSNYDVAGADIDLTVLRYGMIISCNVTQVIVGENRIPLKDSWIELILIMMDTLIENYPDSYLQKCIDFDITSNTFTVGDSYGKYSFDEKYKAYRLFNRNIYVESTFNYDCIFKAILGLTKALDIKLDEIKFHLVNKNFKESKLNYSEVSLKEKIINIDELSETIMNSANRLQSMKLFDETVEVHRIDSVLVAFCNIMYDTLDEDIELLGGNESTGICRKENINGRQSMPIRNSEFAVYSDLDTSGIIGFIQSSLFALQQDSSVLQFKFESLDIDSPKNEWEID